MKQSASDKRVITWPLTSYEFDFLSDNALIVKFKSQKIWIWFVDICGDGEEKT